MAEAKWLLFTYKLASEPSTKRVLVWRRLKRLGALQLHDGSYLLPRTPRTLEQLQWLQAEVDELGGDASLWEASPLPPDRGGAYEAQFNEQLAPSYGKVAAAAQDVLARLRQEGTTAEVLSQCEEAYHAASREYLALRSTDYLGSPAGRAARAALEECSAALREAVEGQHAFRRPEEGTD